MRDWMLYAAIVAVAFVAGAVVFGAVAELLNTCGTAACRPIELYVVPNFGAGLATAAVVGIVLLVAGLRHRSSR
jgi:uncharacterized membrane protein